MSDKTRTEKDPLGELEVPVDALYGVQTLRAVQNFPISGLLTPSSRRPTKYWPASTARISWWTFIRRAPEPRTT